MGDVLLYVGENLSYENEKIFVKPASELTEYKGDPLSVILSLIHISCCLIKAAHHCVI